MSLFRQMARAYVIDRLVRGPRHRRRGYPAHRTRGWGYSQPPRTYARRSRGRGGFFGPFPYYQRRTRGGSRVTVSGCCLPIPLGVIGVLGLGARLLRR